MEFEENNEELEGKSTSDTGNFNRIESKMNSVFGIEYTVFLSFLERERTVKMLKTANLPDRSSCLNVLDRSLTFLSDQLFSPFLDRFVTVKVSNGRKFS